MPSDKYTSHVIIEGADCVGKSTLAQQLCGKLRLEYHHEGVPPGNGSLLEYYATSLLRDKPTCFDRHFVGELCYGPVMRGESRLSSEEVKLMLRLILATGTVIVICDPPLEVALGRFQSSNRAEYIDSEEKYCQIWRRFHEFYSLNCYHDEGDYPDPGKLIEVSRSLTACPRDVVGSPTAKFLFVGERCNAEPDEFHLPFFSTSGSSGYLNERIAEAGFTEGDIAFTNALDIHGKEVNVRDKRQPNQTLIALGGVAHKILEAQGIKHVRLNHPQFEKRFLSNKSEEYVQKLREIRTIGSLRD